MTLTSLLTTIFWGTMMFFTQHSTPAMIQEPPPPTLLTQIQQLSAYHTWANKQITDWLRQADSAQWHLPIESSFTTLELTVCHLWNAEHGWLNILKKEPWSQAVPISPVIHTSQNDAPTQQEILLGFNQCSEQWNFYVANLNEEQLLDTRLLGADKKPILVADIITHVLNHATYHRGQLITMGRQAGLQSPPRTDYIYYIMQKVE
jgi:uncharacterized damage-inducible protein DinB